MNLQLLCQKPLALEKLASLIIISCFRPATNRFQLVIAITVMPTHPFALADVVANSLAKELNAVGASHVQHTFADWWSDARRNGAGSNIRARPIADRVAKLGEHTEQVLRARGIRC